MSWFWTFLALNTAFLLPAKLGPKALAAWRTPGRPAQWRAGRVMFYGGILIWSPAALIRKLLMIPVSMKPFLALHFLLLYGGLLMQKLSDRAAAAPPAPLP
jgi:hypothetical protein